MQSLQGGVGPAAFKKEDPPFSSSAKYIIDPISIFEKMQNHINKKEFGRDAFGKHALSENDCRGSGSRSTESYISP